MDQTNHDVRETEMQVDEILGKGEFLLCNLVGLYAEWLMFKLFLFRKVGNLGFEASRRLFLLTLLCTVGIAILLEYKTGRTGVNCFYNILNAYGLCTSMAYMSKYGLLVSTFLIAILGGCLLNGCLVLGVPVTEEEGDSKYKIIWLRLKEALREAFVICANGSCLLMLTIIAKDYF